METKVFKLNKKWPKGLLIFAGILFTFNGVNAIIMDAFPPFGLIAGVLLVIFGILYFLKPEFVTTSSSRVEFNDDMISIKKSFLSKNKKIIWEDVRAIKLDSYYISFEFQRGQETIKYESDPETSKAIKRSLMAIAAEKGIQVTGG